jgi:DNA-binding response OmpR family regulator
MIAAPHRILVVHGRPGIAHVARTVLRAHGFEVEVVQSAKDAESALARASFDGMAIDVALDGPAAYELVDVAKERPGRAHGAAPVVILVSSVYRRTSYKRRPARLYGADDYVELHHVGDMLPAKFRRHLALDGELATDVRMRVEGEAAAALRAEGDSRLEEHHERDLARLLVSDVLLYNGDALASTVTEDEARALVREDLEVAAELMRQMAQAQGAPPPHGAAIADAFTESWRGLRAGGVGP